MPSEYEVRFDRQDLDLELCVTSGQVFRWDKSSNEVWIGVDGSDWFRVSPGKNGLRVTSNRGEEAFHKLFSLSESFDSLARRLAERGPELLPYVEALTGLRLMRPSDPSEVFFCFLCSANNHLARIHGMVRFLASYGEPLGSLDGQTLTRFPHAERIARIPEAELRAKGFGYRGKSIPIAAAQVASRGEDWFSNLALMPFSEARKELMRIDSVGPKLADCIALYGLHKSESTPFDTHMWQAYCRVYQPSLSGQPLTSKRYEQASAFLRDRFGDLAGLAHLFLYRENQINWRKRGSQDPDGPYGF